MAPLSRTWRHQRTLAYLISTLRPNSSQYSESSHAFLNVVVVFVPQRVGMCGVEPPEHYDAEVSSPQFG